MRRVVRREREMQSPPRREKRRPEGVMPPFVPGGTGRRVVRRRGGEDCGVGVDGGGVAGGEGGRRERGGSEGEGRERGGVGGSGRGGRGAGAGSRTNSEDAELLQCGRKMRRRSIHGPLKKQRGRAV